MFGVKCQTIRQPLHRGALDKQSFHRGSTNIADCRPPLGALPLSLKPGYSILYYAMLCYSILYHTTLYYTTLHFSFL